MLEVFYDFLTKITEKFNPSLKKKILKFCHCYVKNIPEEYKL